MSTLTAEQVRKIEENKKAAFLRRQQGGSNTTTNTKSTTKYIPIPVSLISNRNPKPGSSNNVNCAVKKSITATCVLTLNDRFVVEAGYDDQVIGIMKSIPGRLYDNITKKWTFTLDQHDALVAKLKNLQNVNVTPLPRNVINAFKTPIPEVNLDLDLKQIDGALLQTLLPFQLEGVRFGISRKGRCLIADDMGLGKTIQALGIAHYYVDKWPLLIVCPSSMRFPWEEAIHTFLPSVNPFHVLVMTTGNDVIHEAKVVISSYELLKSCIVEMKRKRFGVIIFDESHFLKSMKSGRTQAALQITPSAQHVILLSGTPALSRPQELYPQIHAIDPTCFRTFHDFGVRYCDGKKSRFGWDYSGSSISAELDMLLKRKFMIRRLKTEVLEQLPSKMRKVVVLQPRLIKAVSKQMDEFASLMEKQRGGERRGTLMQFYCATGSVKLQAVKEYLADKLESPGKILVFAHHVHVLDGLCDLLIDKGIDHIRIDGSTSAECRAQSCETFQNDPNTRVAVLSIKAANSGITLTAAQLVLFAELYWNPGELTQAEDRAHRIGQKDSVVVEYLLAKGTADDFLWALVESKLCVLNSVGLSKDSFRNANTEHLKDKDQPTILNFFSANDEDDEFCDIVQNNQQITEEIASKEKDMNLFDEVFTEDDVFDNLDLDGIEEFETDPKKPKLL